MCNINSVLIVISSGNEDNDNEKYQRRKWRIVS